MSGKSYFNPYIGCKVNSGNLERALNGNHKALDRAFGWSNSHKGHDFWRDETSTLHAGGRLSLEAYVILAKAWVYEKKEYNP